MNRIENIRNQDGIGEREILLVSFGTSYPETRQKTIGAIEAYIEQAFPEWPVRRAFTSRMILKKLRERDGLAIDGIQEALERAAANGVRHLVIQPTHLMDGKEYHKVMEAAESYRDRFESCVIGKPLLAEQADFERLAELTARQLDVSQKENCAAVIMGHGTDAESNAVYTRFQEQLRGLGYQDHYIATVEATPTLEDICRDIQGKGYQTLLLAPLMIVAGDHATNDLAGDEEDSWKSVLTRLGYQMETRLEGLGEWKGVQEMFAAHVEQAIRTLSFS